MEEYGRGKKQGKTGRRRRFSNITSNAWNDVCYFKNCHDQRREGKTEGEERHQGSLGFLVSLTL